MIYDHESAEQGDTAQRSGRNVLWQGYLREVDELRQQVGQVVPRGGSKLWSFQEEDDRYPALTTARVDEAERNILLINGKILGLEVPEGVDGGSLRLTVNTRIPDPTNESVRVLAEDIIVDEEGNASKVVSSLTWKYDLEGKYRPSHHPEVHCPLIVTNTEDLPLLHVGNRGPTRFEFITVEQAETGDSTTDRFEAQSELYNQDKENDRSVVFRGRTITDMREIVDEAKEHVRAVKDLPATTSLPREPS